MGVKILGGRGQVRTTDTDSCDEVNWWNAWINFYSIINDFMTWTRFPNFKHRPKLQDLATRWVWRSRNMKNAIWFLPTVSCQNFSSSGLHLLVFIVFIWICTWMVTFRILQSGCFCWIFCNSLAWHCSRHFKWDISCFKAVSYISHRWLTLWMMLWKSCMIEIELLFGEWTCTRLLQLLNSLQTICVSDFSKYAEVKIFTVCFIDTLSQEIDLEMGDLLRPVKIC